jgi:hypothetical protein
MDVNTAYLIECAIYEKCINGTNTGNHLAEFYRVNPDAFLETVVVTPEIQALDNEREEVMTILQTMYETGIDMDDPRYTNAIGFGWDVYQNEVEKFYEANKPKLDALITQYRAYTAHGSSEK